MLRYLFRFNRNFYDTSYLNYFQYNKTSPYYNYNKYNLNNTSILNKYPYYNFSTNSNKFDKNDYISRYTPKIIDESYNHNSYKSHAYITNIFSSALILYAISSLFNNK